MKCSLFLFSLISLMQAEASVVVASHIDSVGESAEFSISNSGVVPLICEQLDVTMTVIRAANDLPVGSINPRYTNIFIQPGETVTQTKLGIEELAKLRRSDRSVRLFRITTELGACKQAEFEDYCLYANKTEAEVNTLAVLNRSFGHRECSDWNADSVRKVKLAYSGISSVTAFSYFHNLKILRLGGNPIESVQELASLKNLERVCVGNTPVAAKQKLVAPFSVQCE